VFGSRADLARVTAALDADPFADPVSVIGIPMSRKEARRIERDLTAKFSPADASPRIGTPESASVPNRAGLSGDDSIRFHEASNV
jgi:hypothetical protein